MAVSPGPASTVLRFLRGGCGQDDGCLCGRLCEPCRKGGDHEFSEGRVERVLPDRVVLTDGRVFRRPGGSAPRPGQRVIVDPRPGLIAHTPFAPPRGQAHADAAFVPPPPSYATAQRPNRYGAAHVPGNDDRDRPDYRFEPGNPSTVTVAISDDGVRHEIPFVPGCVDHKDRVIRFGAFYKNPQFIPVRVAPEHPVFYDQGWWEYMRVGLTLDGRRAGGSARLTEEDARSGVERRWNRTGEQVWRYEDGQLSGGEIAPVTTFRAAKRVVMPLTVDKVVDGALQSVPLETIGYRYRVHKIARLDPDTAQPMFDANGQQLYVTEEMAQVGFIYNGETLWTEVDRAPNGLPGGYTLSDQNEMVVIPGRYPYAPDILTTISIGERAVDEYGHDAGPAWAYSAVFEGFAWAFLALDYPLPPPLPGYAFRWRSPDGRIVATGPPWQDVQQLLPGDTLSWPGGQIEAGNDGGGSWGAFRTREGVALLIHQPGNTPPSVTRVDLPSNGDPARVTVVSQADFEAGVLQGQKMYGLDLAGPLMNTWPPQHALIRTSPEAQNT